MKTVLSVFVAIVAGCGCWPDGGQNGCAPKTSPVAELSQEDLSAFFDAYRTNARPEMIASAMVSAAKFPKANAVPPLSGFFGRVFERNPERRAEWKSTLDGLPTGMLKTALLLELAGKGPDVVRRGLVSAGDLDYCWGAYQASGDVKYANLIIGCALRTVLKDRIDMTIMAARWSVTSFARKDQSVRKALNDALRKADATAFTGFFDRMDEQTIVTICDPDLIPRAKEAAGPRFGPRR